MPYLMPPERIAEGVARIKSHPDYRGREDDHDFDTWGTQRMVDQLCWIRDLGVTDVTPPLPRLASYQQYLERLHWLAEEGRVSRDPAAHTSAALPR